KLIVNYLPYRLHPLWFFLLSLQRVAHLRQKRANLLYLNLTYPHDSLRNRSIEGKTIVVQHPEGVGIVIQLAAPLAIDVDIVDTGDIPDGGWIAPCYGFLVRAPIIRYQGMVKLPCEITTIIYPFKGNVPPNIDSNLIEEGIWQLLR
ncbi:hypothetical protein KKG56_02235, partial [bacterium]|nr:hypothetical protein [bacterium]